MGSATNNNLRSTPVEASRSEAEDENAKPAVNQVHDNPAQLFDYLSLEKAKLKEASAQFKAFSKPKNQAEFTHISRQNEAMIALNRAKIASFESFLIHQKKLQTDFATRIKQLQEFPSTTTQEVNLQDKLRKITQLNEINQKNIDLITDNLVFSARYQELLLSEKKDIELWKSEIEMQEYLNNIHNQQVVLKEAWQKLIENSLKLEQRLNSDSTFNARYLLEARILLNNQLINLNQYKRSELNLQKKLAKADFALLQNPDIRTLETVADIYKSSIGQLSDMEQALKKTRIVLKNAGPHIADLKLRQQFDTLIKIISARISAVTIQEQTLQEDLENHELALKKQLSVRKNLSEYKLDIWPTIFQQLSQMPMLFFNYLQSLFFKTWDNFTGKGSFSAVFFGFLFILSTIAFFAFNIFLKHIIQDKTRSRLSAHLYDGALLILYRNWPLLSLMGILWILFALNQVPYVNYQLLSNLFFVGLTCRTIIIMARLSLMERLQDSSGQDVYLYYRIRRLLLIGGWVSALMVISHELPLSILLQDIFDRLFMLFLVAVSVFTWLSRGVIRHILRPVWESKKPYFRNAMMLLLILTPLTLFTTAVIGLIGYINLAWTMSRYQVQVLLLITAFVLIRGLLFDALELLSEWMISRLKNGWLWIEIVLKPLDKIARLCLLLFSLFVLSRLFETETESWLIKLISQWGEYPFLNISGIHVTGISVVKFLILSAVLVWASKWTREFCFRWLYRNTSDAGIRNSISVFTQYALILVGTIVALQVLGFDFSGMEMVVGGLAVGMGFGLRDFASNVVGGLMLLIERPVREGDLITLGNFEGKVSHIGIRSMRVSSWDNMEVLIPNAETFNKPFTNWTLQDGIIRTVIPIKVSRLDDPVMVQQLILDVLAIIPEIVAEPPTQVFLKQIDEALIEFEVRYFIDVELNTLFEVRSKVLFAIMAQFKACRIRAPIPPIHVELKESKPAHVTHQTKINTSKEPSGT